MIYTIILERLRDSTLLLRGAPLPPPEQMPPLGEWIIIYSAPVELNRMIVLGDLMHLKDQVANQIVFEKTPARLRVTWTEQGGKIAGKRFERPREWILFDDLTFDAAKIVLLDSLTLARVAVEQQQPPMPPQMAIPV